MDKKILFFFYSFNPISKKKILKCLQTIVTNEKIQISKDILLSICQNSNGDIRNAINSLQFFFNKNSFKPSKKKNKEIENSEKYFL